MRLRSLRARFILVNLINSLYIVACGSGGGGSDRGDPPPAPEDPAIEYFQTESTQLPFLTANESIVVRWKSVRADSCVLLQPEPLPLPVEGQQTIVVHEGSALTLECARGDRKIQSQPIRFEKLPTNAPAILRFWLEPAELKLAKGQEGQTTLHWETRQLTDCQLDKPAKQAIAPNGQHAFAIKATTDFQISCAKAGGRLTSQLIQAKVTQTAQPQAVIRSFTASPTSTTGESTLSWDSVNANSCEIPELKAQNLPAKGELKVNVTQAQDFTLTCRNAESQDTLTASVKKPALPPTITRFEMDAPTPDPILNYFNVKVRWDSRDADRCKLILSDVSNREATVRAEDLKPSGEEEYSISGNLTATLTCLQNKAQSPSKVLRATLFGFSKTCANGEYPLNDGVCNEFPTEEKACRDQNLLWDPYIKKCALNDPAYALNKPFIQACFAGEKADPKGRFTVGQLRGPQTAMSCYASNLNIQQMTNITLWRGKSEVGFDLRMLGQRPFLRSLDITDSAAAADRLQNGDLSGLQGSAKLVGLELDGTAVNDLGKLPAGIKLQTLAVSNSGAFNLASLVPHAPELRSLTLGQAGLVDAKLLLLPLEQLSELAIPDNQIQNLAALLQKFPKLTRLDVRNNEIPLVPSDMLQDIRDLDVRGNPLKTLSLNDLPKLESLLVGRGSCRTVTNLVCEAAAPEMGSQNLVNVTLYNTGIKSLSIVDNPSLRQVTLLGNKNLKDLVVQNNAILELLQIEAFTSNSAVEKLIVHGNPVLSKLNMPQAMPELSQASLVGNGLLLVTLMNMPKLSELILSKASCLTIPDITDCQTRTLNQENDSLKGITIQNTGLRSFSVIGLPQLKMLTLTGNANLERLLVNHNPVMTTFSVDAEPGKTALQSLSLVNNPFLRSIGDLNQHKNLRGLNIIDNSVQSIDLQDLPELQHLAVTSRFCPLANKACAAPKTYGTYQADETLIRFAVSVQRTGLRGLSVFDNPWLRGIMIADNKNFKWLQAKGNRDLVLLNLSSVPVLEDITVPNNAIKNIVYDGDVTTLKTYDISGNPFATTSGL